MRWWICCALLSLSARADYVLDADQLAGGASVNDQLAARYGIVLQGLGDGGPFDVIADPACAGDLSVPNVFSIHGAGGCPELNDLTGFIEVQFSLEQAFVSVRTLHTVSGTISYLMAFDGPSSGDFVDQVFGDSNLVGSPQTLRIQRSAQQTQIRRVRFGVFNLDNRKAAFDDLSFEKVPLAGEEHSWSAIKGRW